jgi:hypothetical protein
VGNGNSLKHPPGPPNKKPGESNKGAAEAARVGLHRASRRGIHSYSMMRHATTRTSDRRAVHATRRPQGHQPRITARPSSFRTLSRDARGDLRNDRVDIGSSVAVSAADDHARQPDPDLLAIDLKYQNVLVWAIVTPESQSGCLHWLAPHFQKLKRTARRFIIKHGDHQPPGIPSEGVKVRSVLF